MQPLPNSPANENNEFMSIPNVEETQKKPLESIKQTVTKWQSTPFFQYFVSKAKDKQKFIEIEQQYNKNLQKKIQNQIQEGKTTVSMKKNMKLTIKKEETEQDKYLREKYELECKKKNYQQILSRVLEEEKKLLSKKASILRNSSRRNQPHFQEMNPKQKQDVFQSLKKLKRFEDELKEKDKSLKEEINRFRLYDIANKSKMIDTMKERNRSQVLQKKQKYQSLKEKEINERKKCQLLVIKMKPQSYKFQRVEQMRKKKLQKMESERKFQEESLRKQRTTISRKELEAHEKAYLQQINQRKQRWITQFQSFKAANRTQERHHTGFFLQKVIREQNIKREEDEEKQERKMQIIKKAKDYSQYVKDCFRPKFILTLNPQKQPNNRLSLTRVQERTKGIENLKFVKEKVNFIKKPTQKQERNVQKTLSLPKLDSKTLYKDYLKQQPSRIKRQSSMKSGFEVVITERKSDWLENAYGYIGKLESKEATKKGKPLIDTVFRKLQLLNALY